MKDKNLQSKQSQDQYQKTDDIQESVEYFKNLIGNVADVLFGDENDSDQGNETHDI